MQSRSEFHNSVQQPDLQALMVAASAAKTGDAQGREQLLAAVTWGAFCCPVAMGGIIDTIAVAWLGRGTVQNWPNMLPTGQLDEGFWNAFWTVIDEKNFDAISITEAVASLGGAVDPQLLEISEAAARDHPGAASALMRPVPGRTQIETLEGLPQGSLGHRLHKMVVDNGYDLEVLDREAIQLSALPQALQYLNVRILQMHDVWHLVAGYETSGSHEIAISAFQLAQFGHNYSAMFLAVVLMKSHQNQPQGFGLLMQLITEAWLHGRETPALMDIEWEQEWPNSIESIRKKYDIKPYASVLPRNLLEILSGTSFWQRLGLVIKMGWMALRLRRGEYLQSAV